MSDTGRRRLMSDAVKVALIVAVAPMFIGTLNFVDGRRRDKVTNDIHTLVNSQMGHTLWIGMIAARNLAFARPTEENLKAAEVAETKYMEHQAKQHQVDQRSGGKN